MISTLKSLEWRYAVKKFDSKRLLSDAQINHIKEVFNLTASSYGLQPVRMVIIQDKELQEQLVPHSFDQLQVAQASHVLVFCIENKVDANYIASYFDLVMQTRGTPEDILNPFKENMIESFSAKTPEEINAWSKNQAYLNMGTLLTACAMEKIDACPMEGFDPIAYDKILKLNEKGISSVLVMPIGYRAEDDFFSALKKVRKSVVESVIEISE